jgi:DNA-directed RNA polymerase subunit alpha
VGQLALKSEAEMLRYRNFGKKSLTEIKEKLAELGLSLGMKLDPSLLEATPGGVSLLGRQSALMGDDDDEADAMDFSKLVDSHLPDEDDED